MTKAELLDKLKRAYEMEEVMASILLQMTQDEPLPEEVLPEVRAKVAEIIEAIQKDTLRHRALVKDTLQKVSEGAYAI